MADNKVQDEKSKEKKSSFYSLDDLSSDYWQTIRMSGRPRWCKIIWLGIILGFLVFTIFMVVTLLKSYFKYKSYNTVSDKWLNEVALPAFTICNINSVNYTEFKEFIKGLDDPNAVDYDTELSWFLQEIYNHDGSSSPLEDQSLMERAVKLDEMTGSTVNFLRFFAFEPEVYLLGDGEVWPDYTFANEKKTLTVDEDYAYNDLGKCWKFNDDQTMKQKIGSPEGGFTIDLNAMVESYLPSLSQRGFMLFLRNPHETVLINQGGILISPGKEVFIDLHKKEIKRLPKPHGTCVTDKSVFRPNITRSVRECIQMETLKSYLEECDCIPKYLLDELESNKEALGDTFGSQNYDTWFNDLDYIDDYEQKTFQDKECGFAKQAVCDKAVLYAMKLKKEYSSSTMCAEPCRYQEFDYSLTQTDYPPSIAYYNTFIRDSMNLYEGMDYAYARENFVRLHIYYSQIKTTEVEQEKAYEVYNFIAEFGGTVDLLIGFSCFLVFQACEVLIAYTVYKCCGSKSRRVQETDASLGMNVVTTHHA